MKTHLPQIIGISGLPGVGKDTLANYLVEKHDYTRYGFADPMKAALNKLFGWEERLWENREWKESPNCGHGARWDAEKEDYIPLSPREWAQWLGTEVGRNLFGKDCWVNIFRQKILFPGLQAAMQDQPTRWVIPDVRFENEATCIRDFGGTIIHLKRAGIPAPNSHISNAGIAFNSDYDFNLSNEGTITQLYNIFEELFNP